MEVVAADAILESGKTRYQEWRRGRLMRKKTDLRPGPARIILSG